MSFKEWFSDSIVRVRNDGFQGVRDSGYEFWIGILRRLEPFYSEGENVYDHNWDVLIILDGCRVDAMEYLFPEVDINGSFSSITSLGSATYQWTERTFSEEYKKEINKTTYITANPFSDQYLQKSDFKCLDEVWRYGWDDEIHTVPARIVTDRGIQQARSNGSERLILHYMQPHFPSVPEPISQIQPTDINEWGERNWESPWVQIRTNKLNHDTVWKSYIENLRYVLQDVEIFCNNVSADKIIITSDHGNAKGEWGIYGHPNVPIRCLRDVPWIVTSGTDLQTHEPNDYDTSENNYSVDEQLQKLGYV